MPAVVSTTGAPAAKRSRMKAGAFAAGAIAAGAIAAGATAAAAVKAPIISRRETISPFFFPFLSIIVRPPISWSWFSPRSRYRVRRPS